MRFQETAEPQRYRDARAHAARLRTLYQRSGKAGRRWLRRWARIWLSRRAPVVVPVVAPVPAGEIVLNGAGNSASAIFLRGGHELPLSRNFVALLRPGMIVFDVGANLGIYTLLAARGVGPTGEVHAFEPVPERFAALRETVRRSGCRQIRLNQAVVSAREGAVPFYVATRQRESGQSSLAPARKRTRRIEAQAVTLDEYAARMGLRAVDLLKIDIEGAELLAFQGAGGLLTGPAPPIIQSELCDHQCALFGHSARDVVALLGEAGYRGYRSVRHGGWQRADSGIDGPRTPRTQNVLFLKPHHLDQLPEGWRLP